MDRIIGWDIGGVNTKAACVARDTPLRSLVAPFEIQRDPAGLAPLLVEVSARLGAGPGTHHAVTMTAELSQHFRTKREGVRFVLTALDAVATAERIHVYGTDGQFRQPADARDCPLAVAASNWVAGAAFIATEIADCIFIDTGTTTTDVIPVVGGAVSATGRTDPARLASGELVYTGALRTPVEAIVSRVPFRSGLARVSAERFALAGDVHLWLGRLAPEDYTVPAPDGRPATREFVRERLARVICADRDMVCDSDIDALAAAVAEAQVGMLQDAIGEVRARVPELRLAVTAGLGEFIAAEAARRSGLEVESLGARLGMDAARAAPAAAVALLLARSRTVAA
ncbi:MAG TPA: hydantoinase/oxoprolinase family protein [Gemmatimonadales bacterium]|nr:hydantoinase/oxoprolinase family protein [Gemmatimonadales bacterium]